MNKESLQKGKKGTEGKAYECNHNKVNKDRIRIKENTETVTTKDMQNEQRT